MLLYHCNFGWPLVDEGTEILWNGSWKSGGRESDDHIFREGNNFKKCPPPLDEHSGGGEAVVFIDPQGNNENKSACGLRNTRIGLAIALRFDKSQLPCLTNWQHWGKGEYVTGLEPGTNPPKGQAAAREEGTLIELKPGDVRTYDLEFEILTTESSIREFITKYNL